MCYNDLLAERCGATVIMGILWILENYTFLEFKNRFNNALTGVWSANTCHNFVFLRLKVAALNLAYFLACVSCVRINVEMAK